MTSGRHFIANSFYDKSTLFFALYMVAPLAQQRYLVSFYAVMISYFL